MWWLYAHVQTRVRPASHFVCVSKPSGVYFGMLTILGLVRIYLEVGYSVQLTQVITVQNKTNYLFSYPTFGWR